MIRAIVPIRFPAKENYRSIRGAAFSSITANVESSRRDKSQRRLRSEIKHHLSRRSRGEANFLTFPSSLLPFSSAGFRLNFRPTKCLIP
jgi:hypothetical protein